MKLNAVEIFDANSAVMDYAWIARMVARRLRDIAFRVDREDLEQVAMVGMIEGSRKPMEEIAESFRHWMILCAFRAARRFLAQTYSERSRQHENYEFYNSNRRDEPRPLVDTAEDRKSRPLVAKLADEEWWNLVTTPLNAEERRFVDVRFREGFSLEETASQIGVSVFRVRELEASVLPVCGAQIKQLKGYEGVGDVNVSIPSFRLRDGAPRNGRVIVEESTGRQYPTISAMARDIGCDVAPLCRALKYRTEFEGRRIRYATDEEAATVRASTGKVLGRINCRSTAVIHLDTGTYYDSVNGAATSLGLRESSLWKSMNMGKKRGQLHGHKFRYATPEEVEARQGQQDVA